MNEITTAAEPRETEAAHALLCDLDVVRSEDYSRDLRDAAHERVAAALAAAGAGEAVDREALAARALRAADSMDAADDAGCSHDGWSCVRKIEAWTDGQEFTTDDLRALAARGDAAPTEVEWGVEEDDGDWTIFAETLNAHAREDAEEWARIAGSPLMRRTVSAWREVRP